MPPLPFAHAGHWLVDLLTLLPVAVLAGWFLVMAVRNRKREDNGDYEEAVTEKREP